MFFHIPPGTIHAIGGSISLVEIQQKSDLTYRLYDYGRPRELHLHDAVAVSRAAPMAATLQRIVDRDQSETLLESAAISVAYVAGADLAPLGGCTEPLMLVPIAGRIRAGDVSVTAGECLWGADAAAIEAHVAARFLAAWASPR